MCFQFFNVERMEHEYNNNGALVKKCKILFLKICELYFKLGFPTALQTKFTTKLHVTMDTIY